MKGWMLDAVSDHVTTSVRPEAAAEVGHVLRGIPFDADISRRSPDNRGVAESAIAQILFSRNEMPYNVARLNATENGRAAFLIFQGRTR
jgi:hypothetical protein